MPTENNTVLVAIAPGCEEIEAVTVIDVLRRAGVRVTVASCAPEGATDIIASRGVRLSADVHLSELDESPFDAIVLPGGAPGAKCLRDTPALIAALRKQQREGRWIAAICAAPALVLAHHELLQGAQVTGHPGFWEQLPAQQRQAHRVVVDRPHKLLTSRGPGTALEFSLALVALLCGDARAAEVAEPMLPGEEVRQQLV